MVVEIKYHDELTKTDPSSHPVLIVGQIKHLNQLKYSSIACKIAPKVSEDVYNTAIASLQPSSDPIPLYLNTLAVAALPLKCSRHNTPSRAHAIIKLIEKGPVKSEGSIVIVCEKKEVYASACAAARAFPKYSRKTGGVPGLSIPKKESKSNKITYVNIEFMVLNSSGVDGEAVDLTNEKLSPSDLDLFQNSAYAIRLSQEIIDKPCNEMNVDGFLKEIEKVGQLLNIKPFVIRGEELREKGFGGIYGVGKAANCPPALAVLSHTLPGARNTIAWVGKGIVYDTGGLSIKSAANMCTMKHDCGGAAGILGAFYVAVKSNFNQNLHAVFCLAENSVGPDSTRPDDIHTLYSGRTVEINNPDAEGRLVMADGVVYAQKDLKANIILDMATLTGAQGIATGKYHGALLSNSEEWERNALEAGLYSGDLLFEVPYSPELHFSEFSSIVADMKNSVSDRKNAQVSCAGLFMMAHLGFDYPGAWLHVDMASAGFNGDRALGYGVALLNSLFGKYTNQPLLANAVQHFSDTTEETPAKKQRLD